MSLWGLLKILSSTCSTTASFSCFAVTNPICTAILPNQGKYCTASFFKTLFSTLYSSRKVIRHKYGKFEKSCSRQLLAELIIAMTLMQERGRERQLEDSKKEGKGL